MGPLNQLMGIAELASEHGEVVDQLLEFVHWFMLVLGVGWSIFIALAIWKFRRRRNARANHYGVRNHASTHIEIGVIITEAVLLQSTAETVAVLHQLRQLGVRIAMDDFGTGYSSLSYLRSFPFDKIKIDRSFVRDLTSRGDAIAIIRAVSGLGRSLGMATTAEGVETEEQLAQVQAEGCTEVQGYFYSEACPAAEIPSLLGTLERLKTAA